MGIHFCFLLSASFLLPVTCFEWPIPVLFHTADALARHVKVQASPAQGKDLLTTILG